MGRLELGTAALVALVGCTQPNPNRVWCDPSNTAIDAGVCLDPIHDAALDASRIDAKSLTDGQSFTVDGKSVDSIPPTDLADTDLADLTKPDLCVPRAPECTTTDTQCGNPVCPDGLGTKLEECRPVYCDDTLGPTVRECKC